MTIYGTIVKETVFSFFTFYANTVSGTGQSMNIRKYQERMIGNRVRFVLARSDFYRLHYTGSNTSDVWNLPVTNKKIMMENLSPFNTLGLDKNELIDFCLNAERTRDFSRRLKGANVGMSSGTSGNKGVEIIAPGEENLLRAVFFARFASPKRKKSISLLFSESPLLHSVWTNSGTGLHISISSIQ